MELEGLELILKKYKNKNVILFFKGFESNVIKKVEKKIKSFSGVSYYKGNEIDISTFFNKKKDIAASVLKLKNGIFWGLYEEFLIVKDVIKNYYDGNIVIVNNNLFNLFPYRIFNNKEKLEKYFSVINDEMTKEKSCLEEIFSEIVKINGIYFVNFLDVSKDEIENIKKENFYNINIAIKIVEKSYIPKEKALTIDFPLGDKEKLELLKYKIYNNIFKNKNIVVNVENFIFSNHLKKLEIQKLIKISKFKGYTINVFIKKNSIEKKYRDLIEKILKKYWGEKASFRKLSFFENPESSRVMIEISQGEIIEDIIKQVENIKSKKKSNDIFITSPTGSGKSVLFQIPAIYLSEKSKYLTIIVTPLKALMKNQVSNLNKQNIGIARYINSDTSYEQRKSIINEIKEKEVSLLYLSPEMLIANYNIEQIIGEREIGVIIVDEAHTVSTWGKNFRVDYWYLGYYLKLMRKKNDFLIVSMTATAVYGGKDDLVFDIVNSLKMDNPHFYIGKIKRDNIKFNINNIIISENHRELKNKLTVSKIEKFIKNKEKAIIYFPWKRQILEILSLISDEYKDRIGAYYSNVDKETKDITINDFKSNKIKIILATKAFGMGIDIKNITKVYHHAPSGTLSDYIQEIGRVAREKNSIGYAEVDFNEKDLKFSKILTSLSTVKQWQIKSLLEKINELYFLNKKRNNFLVSLESFAHIFQSKDLHELEQKVKIGLLLLEKDLYNRYTYPVIIVKPKSMFTKNYAVIPKNILEIVKKSKLYKNFKLISNSGQNKRLTNGNWIKDSGDIYEVDLKRIWEDFFSELNFSELKYKFYNNSLFNFEENISPRHKLTIELENDRYITKQKLVDNFKIILNVFNDIKSPFTKKEFEKELKKHFKNNIKIKKMINVIFNSYTLTPEYNSVKSNFFKKDGFLIKRKGQKDDKYSIINRLYYKIQSDVIKKFNNTFNENKNIFEKYIPIENNNFIELAHMLEAFEIGKYKFVGGNSPEIFIRINDINKINVLSKKTFYRNSILKNITESNERAILILKDFFELNVENDAERWEFIENYFLGEDILMK